MKQLLDLNEKAFGRTGPLEERIWAILEPVAEDMGYRLVRVRVTGENGCTLQIMAENAKGEFAIEDCEKFSREISPILDVEEPIERAYHLEVSSPGVDRPLVRLSDFELWAGHEAKIELAQLQDGRKKFRGTLQGVNDNQILIHIPDTPKGEEPVWALNIEDLAEAKLMMTDKLLDEARARQKAANPLDNPELETEIDEADHDKDGTDEA
ncbi:ribosome maturation factor RimP [Maritalea sp. S77]|uniref:ribosome maturation factor RimP n=1 Tax=Maritalea sp. S77 TaxID=3415125 RepID=UPI003C7DAAE9